MGVYTVARDDFRNSAKSYLIIGLVMAFVGLTAFIFISETSIYDYPLRTLWDVQQAVVLIEPIFVAALCYQAIVGDRTSGRIKFYMGLPNTRAEYFVGKVLARGGFVIVATVGSLIVGYGISTVAFAKSPNLMQFILFAGTTALFLLAFTSIFTAISASVNSRPAAMFGSFGVYFILIPFVLGIAPYMNLETLLEAVGAIVGTPVTTQMGKFVESLTPYPAYGGINTGAVFAAITDQYKHLPHPSPSGRQQLQSQMWFDLLVLIGWTLVPIVLGFSIFRNKDLM